MKTWILNPNVTNYYDRFERKWKNSNLAIDFFWVEMTLEEVWRMFQLEIYPYERLKLELIDNPADHDKFYFWISSDLTLIFQSFWVFPYSGMNSMKEDYIRFDPIEIKNLEELKDLKRDWL